MQILFRRDLKKNESHSPYLIIYEYASKKIIPEIKRTLPINVKIIHRFVFLLEILGKFRVLLILFPHKLQTWKN
ncbi:hypothetical protein HZS_4422 [Henneguya salminicola]|nr:hypothetical protein HZS_4422 [Henneguya salminicola]